MNFIFNDNVRILCLSCNVKKSENLSDLNKKDRNKRHSSSFINVVTGVFFVVRVTLAVFQLGFQKGRVLVLKKGLFSALLDFQKRHFLGTL